MKLKNLKPEIKCLEFERGSDINLIRAICATLITLTILPLGFFLYDYVFEYLDPYPLLTLLFILFYITFMFGVMFFSIRFVDNAELLYRRFKYLSK